MKTVAIIGAGPSGLIAARTLLRSKSGQYKIHIFEKSSEIGGLWAVHKDSPYDGMLNPDMPTNLSRFNIGFSDLAWTSIGLEGHVHYWPKAWQVFEYLKAYAKRYIPPESISFNTRITYAGLLKNEDEDHRSKWKLQWKSTITTEPGEAEEGVFDHLIIATGLFGSSSMPEFPEATPAGVKIVHSTKLRKLEDVAPEDRHMKGKILVVGGGMSGGDAATVLATQLSDASHSPSSDGQSYTGLKVVQLCPDKAYALPLAAPSDKTMPSAPQFLPLDLCMYQLGTRPPGPIEVSFGKASTETIERVHTAFQGIVGDQSDLGNPDLIYDRLHRAPYVTLTELYSGFIRSGDIGVVSGRLKALKPSVTPGCMEATIQDGDRSDVISGIVGVVYATGFSPQPSLDFLSPDIKKILLHDPEHNRLPVVLDEYGTISQELPSLGFIGFHEGAFWGSMEMEARLVEKRWSSPEFQNDGTSDRKVGKSQSAVLRELRVAMTNREADVPQYWLGDYVGLMETLAREVGVTRNDFDWPERTGPVSIYRYADAETTTENGDVNNDTPTTAFADGNGGETTTTPRTETQRGVEEYVDILNSSKTRAKFVARAAFLGMQGHWKIRRTITSFLDTMPSGTLTGTASFHPRHPTDAAYDFEFLYDEKGTFVTTTNSSLTMQASRQYVYRYQESTDSISVWFVKPSNTRAVDYMYHGLTFDVAATQDRNDPVKHKQLSLKKGWIAKADHLCVKDMYRSDYCFEFEGARLKSFEVVHAVKGPKKDYLSETVYGRPDLSARLGKTSSSSSSSL